MTLNDVLTDTTRRFQSCIDCFRPVPDYIRQQVIGIYQMESDIDKGMCTLLNGLIAERDHLKKLLHE